VILAWWIGVQPKRVSTSSGKTLQEPVTAASILRRLNLPLYSTCETTSYQILLFASSTIVMSTIEPKTWVSSGCISCTRRKNRTVLESRIAEVTILPLLMESKICEAVSFLVALVVEGVDHVSNSAGSLKRENASIGTQPVFEALQTSSLLMVRSL
jgi:hypothetical protein